ncbi:hypothetical protein O181_002543 [Austropuccinia psidii MF-1]|uniref:Septation initiation network scaffold protein cdc11 n=1 Tax=Austropuccinia psidii MF-1 TaxID=1389203 RepID=A0A9Q3BCP7_9BASI|nr:hypothetical protein [Austropuccinia psidii MF-1]
MDQEDKEKLRKPVWQTDELSQEWLIQSSGSSSSISKSKSKIKNLKSSSSSSSSTKSKQSQEKSNPENNSLINSIQSSNHQDQDQSIILNNKNNRSLNDSKNNNDNDNDQTPNWLKFAIDGMINDLFLKQQKPNSLEKIFKLSPSSPLNNNNSTKNLQNEQNSNQSDSINQISSSPFSNHQFNFSINDSKPSLSSTSQNENSFTRTTSSSDQSNQSLSSHHSLEDNSNQDQLILMDYHPHLERLKFVRDSRLNEILEETEPSTSIGSLKNIKNSSNSINLNSNLSFHLQNQNFDQSLHSNHSIQNLNSNQSIHNSSNSLSDQIQSNQENSDKSQTIFKFTYDSFARKHLSQLAHEIDGLSSNFTSQITNNHNPLKIKSILGSPDEVLTHQTSSTPSLGLAHSTPPSTILFPTTNEKRVFYAGRTPFRPITKFSERLKEEKSWRDSFVEPSYYAIDSLSHPRKSKYQRFQSDLSKSETSIQSKLLANSDFEELDSVSRRSTKRIKLFQSLSHDPSSNRKLKDSVLLATERNSRRHQNTLHAHPMVIFKKSIPLPPQHSPHTGNHSPELLVRDRLAEARELMDRIRAKSSTGQNLDPIEPPHDQNTHSHSPDHNLKRSIKHNQVDLYCLHENGQEIVNHRAISPRQEDMKNQTSVQVPLIECEEVLNHDSLARSQKSLESHSINHLPPKFIWNLNIGEENEDDRELLEEGEGEEKEADSKPIETRGVSKEDDSEELETNQVEFEGIVKNDSVQQLPKTPSSSVKRRLASSAAASLRQALSDATGRTQNTKTISTRRHGSTGTSGTCSLTSTTSSRRPFATQPIGKELASTQIQDSCPRLISSSRISSASTAVSVTTSVSSTTPAVTTTTNLNSTNSNPTRLTWDNDWKRTHHPKLGLMTIAPRDVEELLQNARVGKMIFDSTSGKWVKARSQSETCGLVGKTEEDERKKMFGGYDGSLKEESEAESSEEEDVFKDIESLNSKRESDSSSLTREINEQPKKEKRSIEGQAVVEVDEDEDDQISSKTKSEGPQALISMTPTNKPGNNFRPKSALKTTEAINWGINSLEEQSNTSSKPSRSVSFQDGRKNGKIVGLLEEENPMRGYSEIKKNAEVEGECNESVGSIGGRLLLTSSTKRVRRKSSSNSSSSNHSSTIAVSLIGRDNSDLTTPDFTPAIADKSIQVIKDCRHDNSSHHPHHHQDEATLTIHSECSFGVNYSKLVKLITDLEPYEPFWNGMKVIDLSGKKLESVVRLNEILPSLDQIDLHSNQINHLTGLPKSLRMLVMYDNQINDLSSFGELRGLERLDLSRNFLTSLQQIMNLKHLRELKVEDNLIKDLNGLRDLDNLTKVSLKGNQIRKINFNLMNWPRVEVLNLDRNQICELNGMKSLKSLYNLNLDRNRLCSFKIDGLMPNLRVLRISENRLERIDVSNLVNLRTLYIDNNDLMEILGAERLRKLENLSARDQRGGELSLPMRQVRDVKRIYLGGNPLPTAFPTYQFYNLLYLELAMCQCQSLPADLSSLIPNVRTLNLNYNFLKDLRPLANLKRLQKLTVVGSRVKTVDRNLLNVLESLPELELLDLRQNPVCAPFYPPVLLHSTSPTISDHPNTTTNPTTAVHLNQYQIVSSDQKGKEDWQLIDDRFRKSLPNQFYLRRMTYRALILRSCGLSHQDSKSDSTSHPHQIVNKQLKWLDGLKVDEIERKKLEKFMRGLSKKLEKGLKNDDTKAKKKYDVGNEDEIDQVINPSGFHDPIHSLLKDTIKKINPSSSSYLNSPISTDLLEHRSRY